MWFFGFGIFNEAALISILTTSHNSILSISRWHLYSFETSCIVFLISSTYLLSVKKLVFYFQKPGPLRLVEVLIFTVIIWWSVRYPGWILTSRTFGQSYTLIKKKSKWQRISGFVLSQVKRIMSGLWIRQISASWNCSFNDETSSFDFQWVVGAPPFLFFSTSQTKLKSPPKTINKKQFYVFNV